MPPRPPVTGELGAGIPVFPPEPEPGFVPGFDPGLPGAPGTPPDEPGRTWPTIASGVSPAALAPSWTGAAAAFAALTVTPQSWVSVPWTVPTTVPITGPSKGIFLSSVVTAFAMLPPVM